MKGTRRTALAVAGAMALAAASACVDLFHSTDFETLCGVHPEKCDAGDAGHADAPRDVVEAGSTDFCEWSSKTARSHAEHACAWLGACSAPFDQNAFGQCMVDAILAYDCNTNPNQPIAAGPLHDLWDGLWQAKSCAEVVTILDPKGVACSGTGTACAGSAAPTVNLECVDNVGGPESCLVSGRACGDNGCAQQGATGKCEKSSCSGTVLHDCEAKTDLGYDCKYFGAGDCLESDAGPACEPVSSASDSCEPTNDVTCEGDGGDTATACATGESVTIDCETLTGKSTCTTGTPSPKWNVAAQCQGPDTCKPGCAGDTLTGCAQGASFTTSCSSQGLGDCQKVTLAVGPPGYACKRPSAK